MKRLEGKTALVTGAARGMDAAIARAFMDEGAFVYLTDSNDELGLDTAKTLGASAECFHLDDREEQDSMTATHTIAELMADFSQVLRQARRSNEA